MEHLHERYTDEQLLAIQVELNEIIDAYVPTMPWDAPTPDLLYITDTYNRRHLDDTLDGVEVQYILAFSTEVTPDTTSEGTTSDSVETGEV